MAKSNMDQDILKVLITEDEIRNRTQELGDQLYDRFHDKNPMFVGVLSGCFIFMADLVRAARLKSEVEFIGLSSYKNATKSSGCVQLTRDLQRDISGRGGGHSGLRQHPGLFEGLYAGQGGQEHHHRHPAG